MGIYGQDIASQAVGPSIVSKALEPQPDPGFDIAGFLGSMFGGDTSSEYGGGGAVAQQPESPQVALRRMLANKKAARMEELRQYTNVSIPAMQADFVKASEHERELQEKISKTLMALEAPAPVPQQPELSMADAITGAIGGILAPGQLPQILSALSATAKEREAIDFDAKMREHGLNRDTALRGLQYLESQLQRNQQLQADMRKRQDQAVQNAIGRIGQANRPGDAMVALRSLMQLDPALGQQYVGLVEMIEEDADRRAALEDLKLEEGIDESITRQEQIKLRMKQMDDLYEDKKRALQLSNMMQEWKVYLMPLEEEIMKNEKELGDKKVDGFDEEQRFKRAQQMFYTKMALANFQMSMAQMSYGYNKDVVDLQRYWRNETRASLEAEKAMYTDALKRLETSGFPDIGTMMQRANIGMKLQRITDQLTALSNTPIPTIQGPQMPEMPPDMGGTEFGANPTAPWPPPGGPKNNVPLRPNIPDHVPGAAYGSQDTRKPPTPAQSSGPKVGTIEKWNGKRYRFKGGDPTKQSNWELVK